MAIVNFNATCNNLDYFLTTLAKCYKIKKKKETNNNTEQNTVQKITGHGKPKIYRYL